MGAHKGPKKDLCTQHQRSTVNHIMDRFSASNNYHHGIGCWVYSQTETQNPKAPRQPRPLPPQSRRAVLRAAAAVPVCGGAAAAAEVPPDKPVVVILRCAGVPRGWLLWPPSAWGEVTRFIAPLPTHLRTLPRQWQAVSE